MIRKKTASAIFASALCLALLAGCGQTTDNDTSDKTTGSTDAGTSGSAGTVTAAQTAALGSVSVSFDNDDEYFDWKSGAYTTLDMSTGAQTVTESGVYEITGTLADGSLIVDVDKSADEDVVYLVLNNTSISSTSSAPVYIKDAEKVVLILEDGTTNTIGQGSDITVNSDDEPSAAIFSKADLTITGGGTLNVTTEYNDGINGRDSLKITGGTLNIQAAGDGIVGKDVLAVENASVTVTAGKDGLRSTNDTDDGMGNILIQDGTFSITSGSDALQAAGILQIDGGTFDLTSGGGFTGVVNQGSDFGFGMGGGQPGQGMNGRESRQDDTDETSDSQKCLKADGGISISGGTFTLSSSEDAVHSNGSAAITGGTWTIDAGDDAVHADADVTIGGGTITIQNSYEGVEGVNITVTGGDIKVTSTDDGFNVNDNSGLLTIGGGDIYVNAGGDGLDSNGSISMSGGTVTVDGPTNSGNGAIDYNSGFDISGGTLIAAGSSGMAEAPGAGSSQPSVMMNYSSTQQAGTTVTLKDESGGTVASFTPSKQYATAVISAPGLKTGSTYTLWSGGTEIVSFTISDTVTYLNESGVTTSQGMGGGQMGGQFGGNGGGQFRGGQAPGGSV